MRYNLMFHVKHLFYYIEFFKQETADCSNSSPYKDLQPGDGVMTANIVDDFRCGGVYNNLVFFGHNT